MGFAKKRKFPRKERNPLLDATRSERFPMSLLTRRQLLAGSAALVSLSEFSSGADAQKPPYAPFRMSLQSYSLRNFGLEEALAKTQGLGISFWEAYPGHIAVTDHPRKQAEVKALLAKYKVQLRAFGVVGFTNHEKDARRTFEFARAMGIETLSASPDFASLELLDRLTQEYKINLAIHNHGPGDRYDKITDEEKAFVGRGLRIGSCDDTGHFLRSNEDPVLAARVFGRRLLGVHLKDMRTEASGDKTFTELGKGSLDLLSLLKLLKKNRFGGLLSLEYEEQPENPIPAIQACLTTVRETLKKI